MYMFTILRSFKQNAFTLAEVLITLGIIGIVAAMTIPMLITKYEKVMTVLKLKKAYSQINQVLKHIQADYGDIQIFSEKPESFVTKYILQYYNGATLYKTTSNHRLSMCYEPYSHLGAKSSNAQYAWLKGSGYVSTPFMPNHTVSILLMDGTCIGFNSTGMADWTNIQVFIDINGSNKGPNWVGRDLFFFVYDENTNSIRPAQYNIATPDCAKSIQGHPKGWGCAAIIIKDGWTIQNDYPW